jgi:hypothetical protein
VSTPEQRATLLRVVAALEAIGLAYCIGGSLASSRYGLPRSTNDVDLVVALQHAQIDALVSALAADFMIDPQAIVFAIDGKRSFNIISYDTLDKIDIFVMTSEPWSRQQLARRRRMPLFDTPDAPTLFFSSPEDVVLSKLVWYRRGGEKSDRQWLDIVSVLATQPGAPDWAYLRRWADELGVADLLARAVASVDQDDPRE